jgi:type IV pilus assembly protein PilE
MMAPDRIVSFKATSSAGSSRSAGVTLLELLIVVAIIGLLGAIGYPSYTAYVIRANHAAAQSVLLQIAERQALFFADTKAYSADLTQLGYVANGFMINDRGEQVADGDSSRVYNISLTNTSAITYTVNATPQLRQASQDYQCQTLTLAHTSMKGQSGSGDNCW